MKIVCCAEMRKTLVIRQLGMKLVRIIYSSVGSGEKTQAYCGAFSDWNRSATVPSFGML